MEQIASDASDIESYVDMIDFTSVREEFTMDTLDNWTTTIGLIQSVIAFVRHAIPTCDVHIFYHSIESHEYREVDREGITSIPDDSLFIGCLSMVSETIPVERMFADYQIDDPIIAHFLQNVYNGRYVVPVVHGFEFLAFLLICTTDPAQVEFLTAENVIFLNHLSARLQVNLYAATIADRRQRELLQMAHYPFILQKHETLNKVFDNLLQDLSKQIDFDKGVAYVYEEESKILYPFDTFGITEQVDKLKPAKGISGQVFETNQAIFVPSRQSHPTYSLMEEEPFIDGSFICVPLGNEKQKLGVVTLVRTVDNKMSFSIEHRYMLEIAAAIIASEIINRQLFEKLDESNFAMVQSLTRALEAKDSYTEGHSERVTKYSMGIAKRLGYPEERIHQLRYGAMLHDIGKIGIGDAIINKTSRLTEDEYKIIKTHTEIGYKILDNNSLFADIKDYVRYHHEKIDGSGYHGKKLGEYPEESMIISCADIYDALTTDRPYRKALSMEEALQVMQKDVDVHFKKYIFDAFVESLKAGESES